MFCEPYWGEFNLYFQQILFYCLEIYVMCCCCTAVSDILTPGGRENQVGNLGRNGKSSDSDLIDTGNDDGCAPETY